MAKGKKIKPEVKKVIEVKVVEVKKEESIEQKRDRLIAEIKKNLLSKGALKRGGFGVRGKYAQEVANYAPVIAEINELGAKLSFRPIGLGHIRG